MEKDVFCKIIEKSILATVLYEDPSVIAIRDIHPQAPVHILVIPKTHIGQIRDIAPRDLPLVGHMVEVANMLAHREGLTERGYRIVINSGGEGGQVVQHLHLHLLGGRQLAGGLG